MQQRINLILSFSFLFSFCLFANESLEEDTLQTPSVEQTEVKAEATAPFDAFTGKVTSSNVRMRTAPSLDSYILTELGTEDMVLVLGEEEDFFAIAPPSSTKAYIFRTFVLDGKIEGTGVNVRLSPSTDSPVIAQLNTGDKITGIISSENSKWLEIEPPANAYFYIAKDYIKKIGGPDYLANRQRRQKELTNRFETAKKQADEELEKTFEELNVKPIQEELTALIQEFESDFPTEVAKAKDFQEDLQDTYLERKVEFLEAQTKFYSQKWENSDESEEFAEEETLGTEDIASFFDEPSNLFQGDMRWNQAEKEFFTLWVSENNGATPEDFELEQSIERKSLEGVLRPYSRSLKNAPGDYLLYDPNTNVPIAFVYSTKVNLQNNVGKKVTVEVNKRPNHHYAFPAFHVSEMR